jgi:hypothetical protein
LVGGTPEVDAQNRDADIHALNNTVNGTVNDTESPADSLQDAGAGKIRGPHGRYVNVSKPLDAAAKGRSSTHGPNIKYVKKGTSSTTPGVGLWVPGIEKLLLMN